LCRKEKKLESAFLQCTIGVVECVAETVFEKQKTEEGAGRTAPNFQQKGFQNIILVRQLLLLGLFAWGMGCRAPPFSWRESAGYLTACSLRRYPLTFFSFIFECMFGTLLWIPDCL